MIECAPHRILCPFFSPLNPVLPLPVFFVILFAYRRRYGDEGKTGQIPVHVACMGVVWGLAVVRVFFRWSIPVLAPSRLCKNSVMDYDCFNSNTVDSRSVNGGGWRRIWLGSLPGWFCVDLHDFVSSPLFPF